MKNIPSRIVTLIVPDALAVQTVVFMVRAWARLYTWATPEEVGRDRRSEVLSDLYDQIEDSRENGIRKAEIAFELAFRMVSGLKDDVAWSVPYVPSTFVRRLERGSEALGRLGAPARVLTSLTLLGLMNSLYLSGEEERTWSEWGLFNGTLLAVITLMWNQHHRWARVLLRTWLGLAMAISLGFSMWMLVEHRVYEAPLFRESLLALLPLALAGLVSVRSFRVQFFRGHWRPVFACWALILAVTAGVALLSGAHYSVVGIWAFIALAVLTLLVLVGLFVLGTDLLWKGGVRGGAPGCDCLLRISVPGNRNSQTLSVDWPPGGPKAI